MRDSLVKMYMLEENNLIQNEFADPWWEIEHEHVKDATVYSAKGKPITNLSCPACDGKHRPIHMPDNARSVGVPLAQKLTRIHPTSWMLNQEGAIRR